MDWVTDRIAIGNIDDAVNKRRLEKEGVTAILTLSPFPTPDLHQPMVQRQVILEDGPGNSVELLHEALSALDTLVTGNKVLVHCREGVSRSPFVVACHLALRDRVSLLDALDLVGKRRGWIGIDPSFYALWEEYLIWRRNGNTGLA